MIGWLPVAYSDSFAEATTRRMETLGQVPMSRLLGMPPAGNRYVVNEGSHFVPWNRLIQETRVQRPGLGAPMGTAQSLAVRWITASLRFVWYLRSRRQQRPCRVLVGAGFRCVAATTPTRGPP